MIKLSMRQAKMLLVGSAFLVLTGCATYRNDLSIEAQEKSASHIVLSKSSMRERKYTLIEPIKVEIKKLTLFHKDPTEEMANELLQKKAAYLNADAVINIIFSSGIGITTWGYIEAHGDAIKFVK
jgi:hypothetical protein